MSKQSQRRLKIFNVFSQNLRWLKEEVNFVNYEFKDDYICPLCLKIFPVEKLNEKMGNSLTLEDLPPASLGGKPLILTCRKCNSEAGYKLDSHLLNRLMELDFEQMIPGSKAKTKFKIGENEITGTFKYQNDGSVVIDVRPQNSNPKQAGKFLGDLITTHKTPITQDNIEEVINGTKMSFAIKNLADERRAEIALLRIAYFLAFNALGYGFILVNNPGLSLVRKQILNPDEIILSTPYWIKYDFEDEFLGINIVREPKNLRCFLVVFDLKTKNKIRRCGIALPGHIIDGEDIYKNIREILGQGDSSITHSVTIENISQKDERYLNTKPQSVASHVFWKEFFNKSNSDS